MADFSEHIRILVFSLLFFSFLFITAYTLDKERLWISCLAILLIISGTIAVLARWSVLEVCETD